MTVKNPLEAKLAAITSLPKAFSTEQGSSGIDWLSGADDGEFIHELRGVRGFQLLREMRDNDPIVGSFLFAIEMTMRGLSYRIKPANDSKQAKKLAMLVETAMHDMVGYPWAFHLADWTSSLVFGWGLHSVAYKICNGANSDRYLSSKYDDGMVRWKTMALRAQVNFVDWVRQPGTDNVTGCVFRNGEGGEFEVDLGRAVHYRPGAYLNSPFGRSMVRNAVTSWWTKKRVHEFELTGIERNLAGYPVLTPTEDLGMNLWDTSDANAVSTLRAAKDFVQNVRRNKLQGAVIPYGWKLELLSSASRQQYDTNKIVERLDHRIASTCLGTFVLMGFQSVGSNALSMTMKDAFDIALAAVAKGMAEQFNEQAIVPLIEYNGYRRELAPTLEYGDIKPKDLGPLGAFINMLSNAGYKVWKDRPLENFLRVYAGLPESNQPEETSDIKPTPQDDVPKEDTTKEEEE